MRWRSKIITITVISTRMKNDHFIQMLKLRTPAIKIQKERIFFTARVLSTKPQTLIKSNTFFKNFLSPYN